MSPFQQRLSRSLPRRIRGYVALPTRLALAWIVLSGAGLFAFRAVQRPAQARQLLEEPARSLPVALPEPATILGAGRSVAVRGPAGELVIERAGDVVTATCAGVPPLRLVGDPREASLIDAAGRPRYRVVFVDPTKARILDDSGALLWRVKRESDGGEQTFKLYDASDTIRHRVKVKADSFNVYAAGSDRIAKGKPRDGAFESRRETGGTDAIVSGDASLRQAAVLSLPVEGPVRVLLWLQAGD